MKTIREVIEEARQEVRRLTLESLLTNEIFGPHTAAVEMARAIERRLGPAILDLKVSPKEEH